MNMMIIIPLNFDGMVVFQLTTGKQYISNAYDLLKFYRFMLRGGMKKLLFNTQPNWKFKVFKIHSKKTVFFNFGG